MDVGGNYQNQTCNKKHEYMGKFLVVCNYISENCKQQLTVEDMASYAGFSKYHFCRLVKQFTGSSFYDYLLSQRILNAERLLMNPEMTITDVAMQSGFNSISTFNRIFKEYKKCTPTHFKMLHRTNLQQNKE